MSQAARQFAIRVVEQLTDAGFQALWAGGCVRDSLMGNEPEDYDVATNARPDQIRQLFGRKRTLSVGESFGVVIVLGEHKAEKQIEVATFRTDGVYSDGRRPDSVIYSTAEEDAKRRDFTINGMFYDPLQNRILDYVGGEQDLQQQIIRAIGDPAARIREDKLRMLRALRFAARFGFELDALTFRAIQTMAPEIRVVSQERITEELRKMLKHSGRAQGFALLEAAGLRKHILPELAGTGAGPDSLTDYLHETGQLLQGIRTNSFELALAIVLRSLLSTITGPDQQPLLLARVTETGKQLKLSNQEICHIGWLLQHLPDLSQAEHLPLSRLKPLLAHPWHTDLLEWIRAAAEVHQQQSTSVEFCQNYLKQTSSEILEPAPLLHGGDLMKLGLQPGPDFALWLKQIREAQLDEKIHSREEALNYLHSLQNQ